MVRTPSGCRGTAAERVMFADPATDPEHSRVFTSTTNFGSPSWGGRRLGSWRLVISHCDATPVVGDDNSSRPSWVAWAGLFTFCLQTEDRQRGGMWGWDGGGKSSLIFADSVIDPDTPHWMDRPVLPNPPCLPGGWQYLFLAPCHCSITHDVTPVAVP